MEQKNQFFNIPMQLRTEGRFCCWKYEKVGKRTTKVPYYPYTAFHAKSNDPTTFGDFDSAVESVANGMYTGIGIGIFDEVCAIDIDHCVSESGELSPLAQDVIQTMQSYTEYSPSKKGVHILFSAKDFQHDKRFYIMNRKCGLEVYVAGATQKYVTVTGDKIGDYEYGDRSENLMVVLERYMKRPVSEKSAVNGVNAVNGSLKKSAAVDDDLPERAFKSKNGDRIRRLWEGDTSGYPSDSEADLALCSHLAFWTQKNPEHIDELFRRSGLMRDKWDRPQSGTTYGAITIQAAINGCKNVAPDYRPEEKKDEFSPLTDFKETISELPPFPVEDLPKAVAEYVRAVAHHTQTSPDMAATISLGVLAICLQGKYRIEGSPGYFEPLSLYTIVIAEPGERKSSVMSAMTGCLYEYEDEYNRLHEKEVRANKNRRKKLEAQIYACTEKLKDSEDEDSELRLTQLQDELAELPKLESMRLIADDTSVEALTSLVANNGGRMGVVSAEGGVFDDLKGRHSTVQNIDIWLKGHCGDPIMIDRLGRNSEKIKSPHLSAILAIQPCVLEDIMTNEKFSGRGFLARMLYSSPPSMIGRREYGSHPIAEESRVGYESLIAKLLSIPVEEKTRTLKLSQSASERMGAYFAEHERFLVGEGQAISEWAGKYIGAVLRVAGLIHAASESDTELVSAETIERAIRIGKYFLAHSKYAYSLAGNDQMAKQISYVVEKIKAKGIHEIKLWELAKECRCKFFKKPDDVLPVLRRLEECGYIRMEDPEPRPGAGRKPAVMVFVNPLIYENMTA